MVDDVDGTILNVVRQSSHRSRSPSPAQQRQLGSRALSPSKVAWQIRDPEEAMTSECVPDGVAEDGLEKLLHCLLPWVSKLLFFLCVFQTARPLYKKRRRNGTTLGIVYGLNTPYFALLGILGTGLGSVCVSGWGWVVHSPFSVPYTLVSLLVI